MIDEKNKKLKEFLSKTKEGEIRLQDSVEFKLIKEYMKDEKK